MLVHALFPLWRIMEGRSRAAYAAPTFFLLAHHHLLLIYLLTNNNNLDRARTLEHVEHTVSEKRNRNNVCVVVSYMPISCGNWNQILSQPRLSAAFLSTPANN